MKRKSNTDGIRCALLWCSRGEQRGRRSSVVKCEDDEAVTSRETPPQQGIDSSSWGIEPSIHHIKVGRDSFSVQKSSS